jgi:RimJ/RimL family protein N-acetyltransferase
VSSGSALEVVRATEADIPYVMATERTPGYEVFIGQWDHEQHAKALADGRHVYFLGRRAGRPVGFAMIRDYAAKHRVTYIKRVVVSEAGQGIGRKLVACVVDTIFDQTEAYRVWLNTRSTSRRSAPIWRSAFSRRASHAAPRFSGASIATN